VPEARNVYRDQRDIEIGEPIYGRQKYFAPDGADEGSFAAGSINIAPLRGWKLSQAKA